jgi:hypothetical protein
MSKEYYQLVGYELSTNHQGLPSLTGLFATIKDEDTGELASDELTHIPLFVFEKGKWVNSQRYYPVWLDRVQFSWSPEWETDKYLTYDDVKKANELRKTKGTNDEQPETN